MVNLLHGRKLDGKPVTINLDNVVYFEPAQPVGTRFVMHAARYVADEGTVFVAAPYDEIVRALGGMPAEPIQN